MENENGYEELDGCMCEYIPEPLRDRIDNLAEKSDVYTSQIVTLALELGLAILNDKLSEAMRIKHGTIKQKKVVRKGKLAGAGI